MTYVVGDCPEKGSDDWGEFLVYTMRSEEPFAWAFPMMMRRLRIELICQAIRRLPEALQEDAWWKLGGGRPKFEEHKPHA